MFHQIRVLLPERNRESYGIIVVEGNESVDKG